MIKWCAYCQQFQGEQPPFDDYSITHGICQNCASKGLDLADQQLERIQILANIQRNLFYAGQNDDEVLAQETVAEAKQAGVQSVDLLIGLIAPLLWKVGELWETGKITVADEHRFTRVYESIIAKIEETEPSYEIVDVLLVNAPGNAHHLGLRVLNLWLYSKGIKSENFKESELESVVSEVLKRKPRFLGFSVATDDQVPGTIKLGEKVMNRLGANPPQLIIGGAAIKRGDFKSSFGITYLSDIQQFLILLKPN